MVYIVCVCMYINTQVHIYIYQKMYFQNALSFHACSPRTEGVAEHGCVGEQGFFAPSTRCLNSAYGSPATACPCPVTPGRKEGEKMYTQAREADVSKALLEIWIHIFELLDYRQAIALPASAYTKGKVRYISEILTVKHELPVQ